MDGRRARSERTRGRLVEAALEIIVREGAAAVTQRKVAAAAGTSLASTTYHFRTADDLVVAAFAESARRTAEQFTAMAIAILTGEKDLIDGATEFVARAPYDPDLPSDAIPQLVAGAAHNERLRAICDDFYTGMAATFAPLTTPPEAAPTVARSITGLLMHELARGTKRPTPQLRDDVVQLFAAFGITQRVAELTRSLPGEEHHDDHHNP